MPVMKEQLKRFLLHTELGWLLWCLVMIRGSFVDPETNKLYEDNEKLE